MKERAYFVFRPRTKDDLTLRNPRGQWMEYSIVKIISLPQIDYDNFISDLLADRQFIEDSIHLCHDKSDCLLVTDLKYTEELLIIPWNRRFVRYAALQTRIQLVNMITQ